MSIKVVDVNKTYTYRENSVYALKGINLQIEKGEFAALTGPSGSGKTTLLNLIGAADKPSSGKIYLDGTDLALKKRQLATYRRSTIGFIQQSYNLIPVLSIYDNIELPMLATGVSAEKREARVKELLKLAGLADYMNNHPGELNIGEQQLASILLALANKPSVVLADEPTGDLDIKTGREWVRILRDLSNREGTTAIIATWDPSVAALADRVFMLRDGAVVKEQINLQPALQIGVLENSLAQV